VTEPHRTLVLRALSGATFSFDPKARCLELGYTGGEGDRAPYEILHVPADLARWLHEHLGEPVETVGEAELVAAIRVRAAIWRCADAKVAGRSYPAIAVREINRAAALPPLVTRIGPAGEARLARPVTVEQVLSTLARDAVDLFTGPRAGRLRRCAAGNCPLVFVDTSRPGRRRWCSMERCGNRAKATTFRTRNRQEGRHA
jgi:predicted RNA-binding Zn ribbon-like protein